MGMQTKNNGDKDIRAENEKTDNHMERRFDNCIREQFCHKWLKTLIYLCV